MSEIADELERMAEEFEEAGKVANVRPQEFEDPHNQAYFVGKATAYFHTAGCLRKRAAKLRALQLRLPKPATVEIGQWWRTTSEGFISDDPYRVVDSDRDDARLEQGLHWVSAPIQALLTDDDWHYLGDGPEPAR